MNDANTNQILITKDTFFDGYNTFEYEIICEKSNLPEKTRYFIKIPMYHAYIPDSDEFMPYGNSNPLLIEHIFDSHMKKIISLNERESKKELIKIRRQQFNYKRPQLMLSLIDRDGYKCKICFSLENLQIDHIMPLSKGGDDELQNLQILCRTCNSKKGSK